MKSTDWDAIAKRYENSKKILDYMTEHPLAHEEATKQVQRIHDLNNENNNF